MATRLEVAELVVKLVGESKQLRQSITSAESTVNKSFGKIDSAAASVDKSFKNIDASAVGLASKIEIMEKAFDQLKSTIGGALDLAKLGAQSERIEQRFEAFAGTIGNSTDLLAAFQRGAGGTVDKMTAMNTAAQLVQQGLVTTDLEMEKTVELATRLGDQTLEAQNRLDAFGQLLKNQSIQLLDNFGISSGKVRARIKELQAATAGLSKEEAFRQAVFEQGQIALDVLGERVDDNAAKFERATAQMKNARVEMGEKLAPAGAKVMETLAALDTTTIALIATLGGGIGVLLKFSGGLGGLATASGLSAAQLGVLAIAGIALIGVFEASSSVLEKYEEGHKQVDQAGQDFNTTIGEMAASGADLGDILDTVVSKTDEVSTAFESQGALGNIIVDLNIDQAKVLKEVSNQAGKVALSQAMLNDNYGMLVQAITQFNAQVDDQRAKLNLMTEAQFNVIQSSSKMQAVMDSERMGLTFVTTALVKQKEAEEKLHFSTKGLTDANIQAGYALDIFTEKNVNNAEAAKETYEAYVNMERATRGAAEAFDFEARMLQEVKIAHVETIEESQRLRLAQEKITPLIRQDTTPAFDGAARAAQHLADKEAAAAARAGELAAKAREVAEAETLAGQAAAAAAVSYANLAISLKDATEKEIARTLIGMLDPEEVGADAFAEGVTAVGTAFGLMDEQSIALAGALPKIAEAFNEAKIPGGELDEVLKALVIDSQDGTVELENLLGKYKEMPEPIGIVSEKMVIFGADIDETRAKSESFRQATEEVGLEVETLARQLENLPTDVDIKINLQVEGEVPTPGRSPRIPRAQHGLLSPGGLVQTEQGEAVLPPQLTSALAQILTNAPGRDVYNLTINSSQPVNVPFEFGIMRSLG